MKNPIYVTPEELDRRFTYHAPHGDQIVRFGIIRSEARNLAQLIVETTPASREQSLALTHLEECVMQANAAIARREEAPVADAEADEVGPDAPPVEER